MEIFILMRLALTMVKSNNIMKLTISASVLSGKKKANNINNTPVKTVVKTGVFVLGDIFPKMEGSNFSLAIP